MKKLLLLLLVVALCLPLAAACGGKTPPANTPDVTTDGGKNTEPTTTADPNGGATDPETVLTLAEGGQAKCRIVFPADNTPAYTAAFNLKTEIAKYLSADFTIVDDVEVPANAETLEILIGATNRPESAAALKEAYRMRDYFCGVIGNKLVLAAPQDAVLTNAVNYFGNAYLVTHKKGSTDTLSISSKNNLTYIFNYSMEEITLMGNSLADYTLVYPANGENVEALYAALFAEHLLNAAGFRIPVATERAAGDACEIVIGGTAEAGKFTVKAEGKRLVISAADLLCYEAAYTYLSQTLFIGTGANRKKVNIPTDFSYTGDRTAAVKEAGSYRVMFHNIWGLDDGQNRFNRVAELLAFYGAYQPDVIGFNEFWEVFWNDNKLAPGLIALGYTEAKPASLGTSNNVMPIFYRADRLTLEDVRYCEYLNMNDRSKGATLALFRTKADNKTFAVVATHLSSAFGCTDLSGKAYDAPDANQTEVQQAATKLRLGNIEYLDAAVRKFCEDHGNVPVLIGGDYNADYSDFSKIANTSYGASGSKTYSNATLPLGKDYGDYGRAGALLKMQSLGYAHAVDLAETRVLAASPHGYPHLDETFNVSAPFPGTAPGGNFYSSIDHTYVRNATGITVKRYETCQEYVTFGISDHSPQLIDVVVP